MTVLVVSRFIAIAVALSSGELPSAAAATPDAPTRVAIMLPAAMQAEDTISDSASGRTDDEREDWTLWLGGSYGLHNYGLEFGARWRFIGLSVAQVDLENRAGCRWIPAYYHTAPRSTSSDTGSFGGYYDGFAVHGFIDVKVWLTLYASLGWSFRDYTILVYTEPERAYFKARDNRIEQSVVTAAVGAHALVGAGIVAGLGISTINGLTVILGYRF